MSTQLELFRKIIVANELGGDLALAYRFSDPDGVRTGKSGWSFGICQFDIKNNPTAEKILLQCKFESTEIFLLQRQGVGLNMRHCDERLAASSTVIDRYDSQQLGDCLARATEVCRATKVKLKDLTVLLHLADYHNQLYISTGGKLWGWLQGLRQPLTPEMILEFKLKLLWGRRRPDDVHRRYRNILKVLARDLQA